MAKFIALTDQQGAAILFNVDHIIGVLAPREPETGALLALIPGNTDDTALVKETVAQVAELLGMVL